MPLGRETSGKEGVYGALLSGTWVGWRGDHFRGRGELKGDIQLCSTTRERLKAQTCLAALLPKVDHMGELVLGESMGSGGPGGVIVGDQPPTGHKDPAEASTKSWQWARDLLLPLASRPTVTLLSLKKCYQAV